jgi:hypothetical protein
MKKLLLLLAIIATIFSATAQPAIEKNLKMGVTLTMPRTIDDEMPVQEELVWPGTRCKKSTMLLWRVILAIQLVFLMQQGKGFHLTL